jgi:seryl-tRNA synthetase
MENNKLSLYSISERFLELFNRDDLTEEEFNEQGNELALMLQNKAESLVGYNYTLESNKNVVKQEIERLTNIYKAIEKQQEKFGKYVKDNMEKLNLPEINTPIGKIKIKKNPVSVEITDESLIDEKYMTKKITKTISKTKIKEDLEKGIEVKGANLIQKTKVDFK